MSNKWRSLQWAGIALIVAMGCLWQFFPLKDASDRMSRFPLSGLGFQSQDFEVTEVEKSVFKGNNLMKRYVVMGGQHFFLSVVDGSKYRNAVHDPTICFLGDGYTVDRREPINVPGGTGELIHMVKEDGTTRTVFLCFSDGTQRYASVVHYWFDTTMRRLTLGKWGEEPIRIIIQPIGDKSLNWHRLLFEFIPLWQL